MRYILSSVLLIAFAFSTLAQSDLDPSERAFLIGENEEYFELLVTEHEEQLLTVCSNSMDKAYEAWLGLLKDMEDFADEKDFDIKGIKLWINVFWNSDGSIRNIAYYPKPNSRYMDFMLLSSFLSEFASNYQFTTNNKSPFSHYGSASFPTFYSFAQPK